MPNSEGFDRIVIIRTNTKTGIVQKEKWWEKDGVSPQYSLEQGDKVIYNKINIKSDKGKKEFYNKVVELLKH